VRVAHLVYVEQERFWLKLLGVGFCCAITVILLLLGTMLPAAGKSPPTKPKNIVFMISDGM
jgi:alkaline phosphatase